MALQPELGSYDGRAVAAVAGDVDHVEYRWLSEQGQRLSHGKLVEWRTGEVLTAMVGSPNLSRVALLRTTRHGELRAAISPTAISLVPEGVSAQESELLLRCTIANPTRCRSAALTLLGARASDSGITVELICREAA